MKILIVEDEMIVAMDLEEKLTAMQHEVVGLADSYESAVKLTTTKKPELVLMDIIIHGDINGIATAKYLQQNFNVPVVFLTAFSNQNVINEIKAVGAYGYMLKPYNDKELRVTIALAFDKFVYERKLEQLNKLLEDRVNTKTRDLQKLNEYLNIEVNLRNRIEEELIKKEKELKILETNNYIAIINYGEKSRKKIAMDLHDGIGQKLTSAKLMLATILKIKDNKERNSLINEAKLIIEETMIDVRDISQNIMPNITSNLGYINSLEKMISRFEISANLEIKLTYNDFFERIEKDKKLACFRIIQEGLNNAIKHAEATEIEIFIQEKLNQVVVIVKDNGIGIDNTLTDENKGNGITNMKKRCEIYGGELFIESEKSKGTTIMAIL